MEAIRIAEEREANVKAIFTRFDTDKSGTIDMEELLVLLDDLGLLTKLKTEPQEFAQDMFVKYDANGDGVLSFEEFKGLYNAAIDDSAGKRKKDAKPVQGRDSKALDGGTLEARKKIAQEKAAKKAEEAERIRKQNAEMKVRAHPGSFAPQADAAEFGATCRVAAWPPRNSLTVPCPLYPRSHTPHDASPHDPLVSFFLSLLLSLLLSLPLLPQARIQAQGKGKDPKALDEEIERKRQEMAAARAAAKAEEKRRIDEENRAFAAKKKSVGAATVNKLSDEENALRAETAARIAAENEARAKQLAEENRLKMERIKSTGAATVNKLSDEENAMRAEAAAKIAAENEAKAAQLAEENRLKMERLASTGAATVNKLSDEENALRAETAAKIAAENEAKAAQLAAENAEKKARLAATGAATDHKLT